ncbi:hypothetical protein ABT56_04315 [Photobacterium aquae]|uniref:Putative DNA-binding domain-containing protein n=1 Tax=Photobacterium aquae TaxID=1195763 RepID=A0A0J1H803_9GAMM|nr:DNA-binding domain-containing protein [Photobacterium aquae]KLV07811.1 hypothetical protein ABT56_04315 [Photobacterium aquae]
MTHPPEALKAIQQAFAEALRYRPSTAAAHIHQGRFPAEQLLQIYRNNFVISLSEILAATYPCCLAVVGEEYFGQLARQHVLRTPPTEGDVSHYGAGLDATIAQQPELLAAVPYLPDLARLEWAVDRAGQYAPPPHAFPFEQLALVTEDNLGQLRLEVEPSAQLIDAASPAASLWQMITHNEVEPIDLSAPESAVVCQSHDGIRVIATTSDGTDLIRRCQSGQPLGTASPAMLAILGELLQHHCFTAIHGLPQGDCAC